MTTLTADQPPLRRGGDHVDIARRGAFDELPGLELVQPRDLVADARGALELELGAGAFHLRLELRQHLRRLSLQEEHRAPHVVGIVGFADEAHTRRAAALDLIQHARARAVREHRVLARADLEHFLQVRHSLAHRAGARKRAEITMRPVELAAMEAQLRKFFAGEADVRVALVVAEEDVVPRLLGLDEVVLEQQRLAFRARHRRLDARDLRKHDGDPGFVRSLLEIARHALLEIARLADIERLARRVEHPVDARTMRQRTEKLPRVERQRRFRSGGRFGHFAKPPGAPLGGQGARRSRRRPRGTSPA